MQLFEERIGSRWIRQILNVLEKKGLIVRATSSMAGRPSDYWMLSKDGISLSRIEGYTGTPSSTFRIKNTRYTHYPHEDLCTLFQVSIERQFPSVTVIRESTMGFDIVPNSILSKRLRNLGYAPDLILGITKPESHDSVKHSPACWIAVEIDRSYRSLKRVSQRVNVYSRHTGFDGVLYLMPKESMVTGLHKVFMNRGASNSSRIKGAGLSFLASGVSQKQIFDLSTFQVKLADNAISLSSWLSIFALVQMADRDRKIQRLSSDMEDNPKAQPELLTN